jgi:hypothetical protein
MQSRAVNGGVVSTGTLVRSQARMLNKPSESGAMRPYVCAQSASLLSCPVLWHG